MDLEPQKDYYAPMHTAEHILNQTIIRILKCERSFSNHIEKKKSKCDYHFNRNLTSDEITSIEESVNEIINSNLVVSDEVLSFKEASKLYKLDKIPDSDNLKIRIVHIGGYDSCPCIGKHVSNTGEIGTFKITTTSFENNVLRIRYKLFQD